MPLVVSAGASGSCIHVYFVGTLEYDVDFSREERGDDLESDDSQGCPRVRISLSNSYE